MMDFYFFVKTFFLTLLIVFVLQIQVGSKSIENHVHDAMEDSFKAGFLGHAATGGAHFIKDTAHQLTAKIKENIGRHHKGENSDVKASRLQWNWGESHANGKPAAPTNSEDLD